MNHAEKCPVCEGQGYTFEVVILPDGSGAANNKKPCHGCNGKGWVEVSGNLPKGDWKIVDRPEARWHDDPHP